MLQQTRDVVAASDARVNMGNALAEGNFEAIDELLADQDSEEEGAEGGASSTAAAATGGSGDALTAGAQAVELPELVSVSTYAGSNAVWTEFRNEAEAAAAEAAAAAARGEIEAPEKVVNTAPREIVYTSEVEPSPAFRAWLRSLKIGGVMTGPEPKALINNMTFGPGEMVDYNLRVTFEGLAEDDTLMVFKDATNAYLTIVH